MASLREEEVRMGVSGCWGGRGEEDGREEGEGPNGILEGEEVEVDSDVGVGGDAASSSRR